MSAVLQEQQHLVSIFTLYSNHNHKLQVPREDMTEVLEQAAGGQAKVVETP
jgi:hypothetical protein